MTAPPAAAAACRVQVQGVVQGVGFRPFVYRLAQRFALSGWVRNDSGAVEIALEGAAEHIQEFLVALEREPPPLARIARVAVRPAAAEGLAGFAIATSLAQPDQRQPVPQDVALCPACERELFDPTDRRYRYPFITCTDCGPRYTVIEDLPYDRERTTMRPFVQCPACAREYADPADRRHHSETNSCPACGPALWLEDSAGQTVTRDPGQAIDAAALCLTAGGILAIRGFGGYHLACDATNPKAVAELRRRKHREAKPLAVMVGSLADCRLLADLGEDEARLLTSPARPILLLRTVTPSPLAQEVSPGLNTIGVMLPGTPLHTLLLDAVGVPLVMTSGNLSEEPIAIGNAEARARLAPIADAFLMHDREILSRCDDSVLRVAGGRPVLLRRARGYAPLPLTLPTSAPMPLLAVGAHLKNTFALVHHDQAWVSPHIGDLETIEGVEHFQHTLAVYRRLFRIDPAVVVHDLHPGYLSTRIAEELNPGTLLAVQHHHAHVAAVLAEHGETGPAIGVAFDGTGYGTDGTVWGAEILVGDLRGFWRLAHLRNAPLPGGDLAARQPWRVLAGYQSLEPGTAPLFAAALAPIPVAERIAVERQLAAGVNAPLASSMGRLFDAAAAILGLRLTQRYEGQAAMELEALAGDRPGSPQVLPILRDPSGGWEIDPLPLLAYLAEQRARGVGAAELAADFHDSIVVVTGRLLALAGDSTGLRTVVLSGGVFQNARLLSTLPAALTAAGFRVLLPRQLPPNDGAISFGQAAMASARLAARS
jgi:hydrogenase maturation protein HypF